MDELERRYMHHVLALVKGNKSAAARILGFDRRTLYRRIERGQRTSDDATQGSNDTNDTNDANDTNDDVEPETVAVAVPIPPNGGAQVKSKSVLVVDDDADSRELVQIVLEARGYRVETARGVAEAMRARDVDLVLTDLHLGDGSGADLVGRFGRARVVALTGEAESDQAGLAAFDGWLTKPVSVDRLTKTLQSILDA